MNNQLFADKLAAARASVAKMRSEAFVDYQPCVCGLYLEPVSLRTYSRLLAFDSPFLWGGPVRAEDIAVFVWVHRPEFGQHAAKNRQNVFMAVMRALKPRFPAINEFLHLMLVLLKLTAKGSRWGWRGITARIISKLVTDSEATRCQEAVATIRRLISEALIDFPKASEGDDEEAGQSNVTAQGPSVAMQAQFVDTLARDLHFSPEEVETMPLRRAVQHYRYCLVASGAKGLALLHPEEAKVWREVLAD
jgi:hypothetical protein